MPEWPYEQPVKWIFPFGWSSGIVELREVAGGATVRNRTRYAFVSVLLLLLAFVPADASKSEKADRNGKKTVYVCACLKTKSCACMTEAKMQGPCACGTEGGPPMQAVSADSDWAKENREALAK